MRGDTGRMARVRVTEHDPNAAHQIRLIRQGQLTMISCVCMMVGEEYREMGLISPGGSPWPIYNDPKNHNQMRAPFVPNAERPKVFDVRD